MDDIVATVKALKIALQDLRSIESISKEPKIRKLAASCMSEIAKILVVSDE